MTRKNHKMENGRMPRKEEREVEKAAIHMIPLDAEMSVCKVADYFGIDLTRDFGLMGILSGIPKGEYTLLDLLK